MIEDAMLEEIWLGVVSGALPAARLELVREVGWQVIQDAFLRRPPPREYRSDQAGLILEATGVRLEAPSAMAEQGFDPPSWIEKNPELRRILGPHAARDQRRALATAAGRLQDTMIREGCLRIRSPFDGRYRVASASFLLDYRRDEGLRAAGSHSVYLFNDGPPLFLIFGGEECWPMAWLDPFADLLVRERGFLEVDHFFGYTIAQLKTLFVRQAARVIDYLRKAGPRSTTVWFGSVDYMSTHLFEDISGLDRVVRQRALPEDALITVAAREIFGPVEELFPEIEAGRVLRPAPSSVEDVNVGFMELNRFVVRPAGGFATPGAVARVQAGARRRADGGLVARLSGLRATHDRLLFVALRQHNRRWQRPPTEIAGMLNRIAAAGRGSLAILFDGYSMSAADDVAPDVLAAEADYLQTIISHLDASLAYLVVAGLPVDDAVHAAAACHCHLSIQGTSTTKSVLLADLPGVVIGPDCFWWDVRDYRCGTATCVTLGPGQATDAEVAQWPITDFDLPVEAVEAALLAVIDAL